MDTYAATTCKVVHGGPVKLSVPSASKESADYRAASARMQQLAAAKAALVETAQAADAAAVHCTQVREEMNKYRDEHDVDALRLSLADMRGEDCVSLRVLAPGCLGVYAHTRVHAWTHAHARIHTFTHWDTHAHKCRHARMHAYTSTCAEVLMNANKQMARGRGVEKEKEKLSFRLTLNLTRKQPGAARASKPRAEREENEMLRRPSDSASRSVGMTTGST